MKKMMKKKKRRRKRKIALKKEMDNRGETKGDCKKKMSDGLAST